MKRKIPLTVALSLIILAIALTICATMVFAMRYFSGMVNKVNERRAMYEYVSEIDTLVRENYTGEIDEETLSAQLAKGYVEGIGDPYARYYNTESYALIQQELSGKYTGFGIDLTVDDQNQLVVTNLYKGSAAEKAGIAKQDVVVALDGSTVNGSDYRSVKNRLENSSKLLLSTRRDGVTTVYNLSSGTISLESVEEKVIGNTGYIRLYRFSQNTPEQFKSAYSALLEKDVDNFVFDLRDNTGGSLEAAQDIIAYLMPRGVYANKVSGKGAKTEALSASDTYQMDRPTVTLVNKNTAGEAELFAGVLQEFEQTEVIGDQTAGRSRVQAYFTLASDSAGIRLSVATLQLVTGGSWEGKGITPDQVVTLQEGQSFDLLPEKEDSQLQAALKQLTTQSEGTLA